MDNIVAQVKEFSNQELKELLIEHIKIGNVETPVLEPKSENMELLYKHTLPHSYFRDKYFKVKIQIETEILSRIAENKW